ncbi:MAG: OmpA family protein, partial [Bacteroidia bacterium]|nr:OmpA family protein [Bacteroidia bacterium]
MKYFILVFCIAVTTAISAQNIQWATELLEYSSQYMSSKYSAEQVLGTANVYPDGGDNKLAWSPKSMDGKLEFVKVGFAQPMAISQIVIYETHKP